MHTRETSACEPLRMDTARFIASLPMGGQRNKKNVLPKKNKSTKKNIRKIKIPTAVLPDIYLIKTLFSTEQAAGFEHYYFGGPYLARRKSISSLTWIQCPALCRYQGVSSTVHGADLSRDRCGPQIPKVPHLLCGVVTDLRSRS